MSKNVVFNLDANSAADFPKLQFYRYRPTNSEEKMTKHGLKVIPRSRKKAKDSSDLMKWWIQYNIFYNKYNIAVLFYEG